jgi:UDP-2,4-diacetamido-2,4,6-trideoxy-beta-L-altropyranose hydrolase
MSKILIIRADASVAMGTGHVMRCLALAQAWQDAGGSCAFAMSGPPPAICERLRAEGCEVLFLKSKAGSEEDAGEVVHLSRSLGADLLVVDGYQFGDRYQDHIKTHDLGLLFVDDNGHAGRYSADVVLNQNAHASPDLYRDRAAYTELLLGSSYAMLRREFTGWRAWKRKITPIGRNVLVTMGGSDPGNVTASVIRALRRVRVDDLSLKVVVGASNPHHLALVRELSQPKSQFEIVSSTNCMPELMAWADFAISAAGSTCWEMCFLGLPAIIVPIAENQEPVAEKLDAMEAAKLLSKAEAASDVLTQRIEHLSLCYAQREKMSSIGRTLVDGEGVSRVVRAIRGASVHAACHG